MKNMSYEEFKKQLLRMLRERMRDSIKSEIIPVNKNNGIMKETVGIENGIDGLKPLVYVESLYDQYCIGADLSTCVSFVVGLYRAMPDLHMEQYFETWEAVKPRITVRVMNWEWNKDELRDIPHKKYMDLAVYCRVVLAQNEDGIVSTVVKNSMLRYLEIEEKELWEAARNNFQKEKYLIRHIDEETGFTGSYLNKFLNLSAQEDETHILTNEYHNNGAVGMMRFDLLERFTEQKKCNLYILPSSLNEVILIPDRGDRTPDFLRSLVKKNNKDYPDEGDLSENIYYYRRGKKQLEIIL